MKKQKQAVVDEVLAALPGFNKGVDNALSMLTTAQLESIKSNICTGILNGQIEYSKDLTNKSEVISYGRSMVMNHLKKSSDLTGPKVDTTISGYRSIKVKTDLAPKGVDLNLLPEDLREYAKSLRD
jgi:hypothetical protein